MSVMTIPRVLREKLGEDGVDALLAVFSEVSLDTRSDLATKSDLNEMVTVLRRDMVTKSDIKEMVIKSDIKEMVIKSDIKDMVTKSDIKDMATKTDIKDMATKEDIANLKTEIEKSKTDSIKWMLAFWATQIGILIAAMGVMFKFLIK